MQSRPHSAMTKARLKVHLLQTHIWLLCLDKETKIFIWHLCLDIEVKMSHRDTERHQNTCKALSLCVCYAATCGGIASLTGTAPNIVIGHVISVYVSCLVHPEWPAVPACVLILYTTNRSDSILHADCYRLPWSHLEIFDPNLIWTQAPCGMLGSALLLKHGFGEEGPLDSWCKYVQTSSMAYQPSYLSGRMNASYCLFARANPFVLDLRGQGLIPGYGEVLRGIFPWLITHTWRRMWCRQVGTNPLKGYEEYKAISFFYPQVPRRPAWSCVQKMASNVPCQSLVTASQNPAWLRTNFRSTSADYIIIFIDWLIKWLIDWFIGWLNDGLVDWLIDWLIGECQE